MSFAAACAMQMWNARFGVDSHCQRPESASDLFAHIDNWKAQGLKAEIRYMGIGRIADGYGHYAFVAARRADGGISGKVFALTAFDYQDCIDFAAKHNLAHAK